MFKFTGIKEEKEENTDNAIMNIVRKGGDGYLGKHFIILLRKYFIMLYQGNFICVKLIDITRKSFDCQML